MIGCQNTACAINKNSCHKRGSFAQAVSGSSQPGELTSYYHRISQPATQPAQIYANASPENELA
jgi:hypothetical protein